MSTAAPGALRYVPFTATVVAFVLFAAWSVREGLPTSLAAASVEQKVLGGVLAGAFIGMLASGRLPWLGGALFAVAGVAVFVYYATADSVGAAILPAAILLAPATILCGSWLRHTNERTALVYACVLLPVLAVAGFAVNRTWLSIYGPTHPGSSTELPPVHLVEWAWAGAVTDSGFTVKARLADDTGAATLRVSLGAGFADSIEVPGRIAGDDDYRIATFELRDLEPGTQYHYAVAVDGELDTGRRGSLRTFPRTAASFVVAFGACARNESNGSVFDAILDEKPLLFISTGDFHYRDITSNSTDQFQDAYDGQLRQPAQQALYSQTAFAYTWDDHDFGGNGSNMEAKAAPAALSAYREIVPHYPLVLPGSGSPIAQAFSIGRVRFIISDARTAREPADGSTERSMLGEDQLAWLTSEFLAASRSHALVAWVNPVPWIAGPDAGADHWGAYDAERRTIAEFLSRNGIENVIILSGDAHMLAIDDGTNTEYSGDGSRGPVLMHAAALDRPGEVVGGPYSEGTFPGGGQFGLFEVQDDGGRTLRVRLRGMNHRGEEVTSYEFEVPAD